MLALVVAALFTSACPEQKAAEQASSALTTAGGLKASELVRNLALGQFDAAERDFSPVLKREMPPQVLAQLWQSTVAANGAFLRQGPPIGVLRAGMTFYRVPLTFERKMLEAQLSYDKTGAVTGFAIANAGVTP